MSASDHADVRHCVNKIQELVASGGDDRRTWLQLGYNLGRLSELSSTGRSLWDAWKGPVAAGDRDALSRLADALENVGAGR